MQEKLITGLAQNPKPNSKHNLIREIKSASVLQSWTTWKEGVNMDYGDTNGKHGEGTAAHHDLGLVTEHHEPNSSGRSRSEDEDPYQFLSCQVEEGKGG